MTFAELRDAILRLPWGDRVRLMWEIARSLLSSLFLREESHSDHPISDQESSNHLSMIHPSWPTDFAQKTAGQWHGEPLVRANQETAEHRDVIDW